MTSQEVTICNRLGLHARAAAKFVHTATRYSSQIKVSRDGLLCVDTLLHEFFLTQHRTSKIV